MNRQNTVSFLSSFCFSTILLASFHRAGPAGDATYRLFKQLFGIGYFCTNNIDSPWCIIYQNRTCQYHDCAHGKFNTRDALEVSELLISSVLTPFERELHWTHYIVAWPFVKLLKNKLVSSSFRQS